MILPEFKNEKVLDFSIKENREKMEEAIKKVKKEFGKEYPSIINGKEIFLENKFKSFNPGNKDEVIGIVQQATEKEVNEAIEIANKVFNDWRWTSAEERAGYLLKAAKIMREKRVELDTWLVFEVGKNWVEADADVCEAIDFMEFYAREALRYDKMNPVIPFEGEIPQLKYIPLGVGAVIPPWNFPMAILTGMTTAAIVTGNTVVLKPSSDSPVIGAKFMEIMREAGLPDGVINFLPGKGGVVGDAYVIHPKIRFIAFTGSKDVGLRINELASKTQERQIWIKRVILEMGGKDAIIVDESADIDDASNGVITSAFGYQGQKCSACSRAIIHKNIYEKFIEKLVERVKEIKVGPPEENYHMGPVINERAYKSILEYIEIGKKEGKLVYGGNPINLPGYYIEPTIIIDVKPDARIAQEEIFGPVLAVIKAEDFDDAINIANNTIYGLTGSVYTKNRKNIEKAKKLVHCGNLYINRKCTGALVGVHPFGGFNMSGTDSKAGGKDYLLLFLQAKAISEKI